MAEHAPSFSPARRFGIGVNVAIRTLLVIAVLVMAVHLAGKHFRRDYLSSHTRVELSSLTVNFVKSITNSVKVTLYFDRDAEMFSTVDSLLKEYRNLNQRIQVRTVDYVRDAAEATRVKGEYKLANSTGKDDKNLIIFECDGRVKVVNASMLADYTLETVVSEREREYRRKPVAFRGEMAFTSLLLAVTNPKPLKAMFLTGHEEHDISSADEVSGYQKLRLALQANYIQVEPLTLIGTNTIPDDCNLLVIAGPRKPIPAEELDKVQKYLEQGGRLMVLFNPLETTHETGLERMLVRWGVVVGDTPVVDPSQSERGKDIVVSAFSLHPIVNPLLNSGIQLILPRPLKAMRSQRNEAGAPKVELVAYSTTRSYLADEVNQSPTNHAVVAVVQTDVPGVATERGVTRIVVVGDSTLFVNTLIEKYSNRDFASCAANWLLDRSQLMGGLGPRPVNEYRVSLTRSQMRTVQGLLLGALPGGILLLGGLVWLRRRK